MVLLALVAVGRRTVWPAAALGAVAGLAILSNTRLLLLPLVLAALPALGQGRPRARARRAVARRRRRDRPWVVRNQRRRSAASRSRPTRARSGRRTTSTPTTRSPPASGSTTCPSSRARRRGPSWSPTCRPAGKNVPDADECAQMRLYQHEVRQFWLHHPGEKLKLMAQATVLLWQPSVFETRGRAGRRRRGQHAALGRRAAVRDPALPARDRRLLVRAAPLPRARARLRRLRDVRGVGLRRDDALPRRLGLPAGAARRRGDREGAVPVGRVERCRCAGRSARSGRPPRSARCSGPRGSARPRARAPARPISAAPAGVVREPQHRRRRATSASPGGDEQARLAVADEVLEPADRRGDHRPRALHRLERDHAEALAERRHDDDVRLLDRRAGSASRGRGSAPPRRGRARARGPSARARARRGRRCRAARRAARRAPCGTRAAARRGP